MADSAHLGPNNVSPSKKKSMNILETLRFILQKDGVTALWRGLGPALVLVSNPVIQYTVFEQLKNALVRRRTEVLRATGVAAVAVLSDWDFFLLGALSKLGMPRHRALDTSLNYFRSRNRFHVPLPVCTIISNFYFYRV